MGMLSSAKNDAKKGDDSQKDDGGEKGKKHKKRKHPSISQAADDGADSGPEDEGGGDEEAPGADADAQGDAAQGGAAAPVQSPQDPASQEGGDDQGEAAGAEPGSDPQAGGGAQGGTPPVVNMQAPGAGDDTSGGEDTPDDEEGATDVGGDGPAGDPSAMGGPGAQGAPGGGMLPQVPMSPAMKEEYQNLDRMLVEKLYQGGVAQQMLPSLLPQGPQKVKGVVTVAVVLARELMLKTKAPLQLALPFARDCAAHCMQIGQEVKGIQYSDQEATAVFGAAYEGVLRAFGVKKDSFNSIRGIVSRKQFAHHAGNYITAHGHAAQAAQANGTQNQVEHADQAQPQGPAAQAGGPQAPQGGPPAAGGGMIAQGAAAAGAQPDAQAQPEEQA